MKRLGVVMLLVVALLAGCGDDPPQQGYVVDRKHEPAHYHEWTQMVCASYTKEGYCNINVPIQHRDYVPDKWKIKLRECTFEDNKRQKCKQGWLTVSEETHNSYTLGEHYPNER